MLVNLNLESQVIESLTQEAAKLGIPVEQLAVDIIRQHVEAEITADRDKAFRRAMNESMAQNRELLGRLAEEYVLAKNAELYRRLAKSDTEQEKVGSD